MQLPRVFLQASLAQRTRHRSANMLRKLVVVCLATGAYAVNGYGRPDLSDLDDFDGPVTPTTPAAPTGTGPPTTASIPTSSVAPVSPARPAVPAGTPPPLRPVVRPTAVPFSPATGPAIFAPGAAGIVPSGLPGEEWKPYSFGYDITDEFGNRLFHNEQSDNKNAKTGTYGYRNVNGLFRTVSYVADADGYRATIDTNEPGTASGASADAVFNANPVAAPPTAPRPGGYTKPVYNGPVYIRPAAPHNVRGPGRYTGSYAGGYDSGFRGPYGGGSGGGYRSDFGRVYSGSYGSGYSGSYGSVYGGGPMGGYAGGNAIVYPGRYRAAFGTDNSGAYRGVASPGFGYGGAGNKAVSGGAGYGVTYIATGNEAGYRAGYTGAHRRGYFGAGHSGGYASSSALLAGQHGLHSHHGFLGHHGYRG